MINTLNKTIVNDTFNRAYNEEQFKLFIKDLLLDSNFEKAHNIMLPNDYKDFIKSARRICKYKYTSEEFIDDKVIDVLVVKLKKTTSVERARVAQRNFVARYLNGSRDYQKDGALVAFISENEDGNISPDWRFSFVQMNYKTEIVEKENGKKKRVTSVELTPAKRFSFLVGENEDTHTAQRQFATCLEKSSKGEKITIEDLVQAFDIEKVSKEFFDKYKALYLKLRDELIRLCNVDKIVKKDFEGHNINVDDFAKKTLGQLVFLYFIQKKGWLGVQKDKDWGTGDKKFLRNVFDGKYGKYDNFFNDILEHLFYEALAYDRGYNNFEFEKLNCRIPFLNGGLFEPVNGYEWTKTDLTIDNKVFKEIFDTFDLYNFTVKEDEPLEKEVAIDPEMLGKVFENLIEENERKGNGAFYTPREIVHYMCQESLINYLYNKINIKEVPLSKEEQEAQLKLIKIEKSQEQLPLTQEVIEEIISKEDIEFLIKTGNSTYINKQRKINVVLPDSIRQNADILDNALSDIKVCDPAIGSGAFPVGMMNEIVRARATLSEFLGVSDRPIYELKRHVIENSIYGVDIDPGAVDIAKLRFWLSLVVDEEDIKNIKPLPNLDYKIMQGNSLITSYEGIDFDEIVSKQPKETQLDLFSAGSRSITEKISKKQNEFLNTPYPTHKGEIKQEIEDLIVELVKTKFEEKAIKECRSKDFYEEQIRNFAKNQEKREFFPWKLFFADVFDKGGFDVVIGNPPYVQLQKFRGDPIQKLYKDAGFRVYDSNGDLYCLFYEQGISILKRNGNLTYITSNKWLRAGYGENLRELFVSNNPLLLVDFNGYNVFETATVDVNILMVQKTNYKDSTKCCSIEKDFDSLSKLGIYIQQNNIEQKYTKNAWCILSTSEQNIKNKIELVGTPIKDTKILIYRGLLTGLNEAFIIDGSLKDKLIKEDKRSSEIIKPILRGRDIKKYNYSFADKWLILTHNGDKTKKRIDINQYRAIKNHLDKYYDKLAKRDDKGATPYNLRNCAYLDYFNKPKIIWADIATEPSFVYSEEEIYFNNTCYMLSNAPKCLLGILNSKLIKWYFPKIATDLGTNGARYFKQFVELIPIPELNLNNVTLKKLEDIINSKQYNSNQIDNLVYKLYDLTYQEVLTIDPDFSLTEEEYNNYKY